MAKPKCPVCGRRPQDTPIKILTAWTGTTCPGCINRALAAPTGPGAPKKDCAYCGRKGGGIGDDKTRPDLCAVCASEGRDAPSLF